MKKLLCFIIFTNCLFFSFNSCAMREITINEGHIDPIPVAINNIAARPGHSEEYARKIQSVISNDLHSSSYFRIIHSGAFIENKVGVKYRPLFGSWRQIKAEILLNAEVEVKGDKIELSFIVWDTTLEKDIHKEILELPIKLWRRGAHKVADSIYQAITGDKGYFDTRIAYIAESGPRQKRVKRLAVMDFDGENHKYLTDGNNLVLTPRFSPNSDKVLYMSYANHKARVYMKDLKTGRESVLGDIPGITFSPKFSPDGSKALISVAKNGATNILEIDLKTKKVTKLTNNFGINTSPSYSPDGKKIVFNSNRGGGRQLYVMDSDGTNIQRISFGGGMYATPVWSPTTDYIAYTKQNGNNFVIGVMRPDGTSERTIASGFLVEGPTWSPSGKLIMFTKESKGTEKTGTSSRLYYVDVTGNNEHSVPTPKDASDPEWSRLLD